MDPALIGLLGAIIGASASLLGTILSNRATAKKEQQLWELNRQKEQDQWTREKLQEIYSNCLSSLAKLFRQSEILADGRVVLSKEHQRELFNDYSDAQKWVNLLLVYYPRKGTNDFSTLVRLVNEFSSYALPNLQKAKELQAYIIAIAGSDPRLQELNWHGFKI
jgi:hypothetical protein